MPSSRFSNGVSAGKDRTVTESINQDGAHVLAADTEGEPVPMDSSDATGAESAGS